MKLLAKSEPAITLQTHIDDCLVIWHHLKECFPQLSETIQLDNQQDFWAILRLCIIFHDLGKAHPEFQKLLANQENNWLGQRHELFSLPFLEGLEIDKDTKKLMRWAVAGHHKDYEKLFFDYIQNFYQGGKKQFSDFEDEDKLIFEDEFKKLDISNVQKLLKEHYQIDLNDFQVKNPRKLVASYISKKHEVSIYDPNYFQLLILFGALKHCDHLGSARLTEIEKIDLSDFYFLTQLQDELKSKGKNLYQHQIACGQSLGNVILTAPTGSGKTESALLWLKNQITHFGQGRVFYILPFTASINAMYERLNHDEKGIGKDKVGMLHGKLSDYLYDYLDDLQYANQKKEMIKEIRNKFKTLYTPLKVLTPFQLLKHIFGLRGFEQGMFEWIGGYFIFDEIHAYSPEVFAQIKILLEFATQYLKVKVLVMTATLPQFLKEEIKEAIGENLSIQADQSLYDQFDRHQVQIQDGLLAESISTIQKDLEDGRKVLVVCNTVKQSQNIYQNLHTHAKNSVLLHSGFNGEDRTLHEKELKIGENQDDNPIMLLVGTQAIEVSLDIDYNIIYTEPAPLDALIQRFGRVNRKREKGICPVVVFKDSNESDYYIYSKDLIQRTLDVLENIIDEDEGVIKESKLQSYMNQVYPGWTDVNYQSFQSTYKSLKTALHSLLPMIYSKTREEDFYKMFDGVKVLPVRLKERYENYLLDYNFIKAEGLKVQIRSNKFKQLVAQKSIEKHEFNFENQKQKLISIPYWVINKGYSEELGILYEQDEAGQDNLFE